MSTTLYIIVNLVLVVLFLRLMTKKDFLTYLYNGRWLLTWVAVGIITMMDELTSIFYANSEAYRFIGLKAIVYIALTSVLIRFLSTRLVEIGEILEVNNIRGGGVYSFSYLVLGPSISFIAIASILVDYILTATISTVSAVENGTAFFQMSFFIKFFLKFGVIWLITMLNIIGIKENAKFTYLIFVFAAFVLVNLILGGALGVNQSAVVKMGQGWHAFMGDIFCGSIFKSYENIIIGIGSCILAYSGIESVLQTASLVKSWKEIRKAYLFLALTVGIVTPLIAVLALTSGVDVSKHESDLIPAFAAMVNGPWFGVLVAVLASVTLIMAVNTAMVASAELIEKVAERYNYQWLVKLNKTQSLYRIHIFNGLFYSIILVITNGSQAILAEMYAVGLVASFCINTGSLLIYRFSKGTKEITYHTSRVGTLLLWIVLISTFIYIVIHRPYGTAMWLVITSILFFAGLRISKLRGPEIHVRKITKTPMDVVFAISDLPSRIIHLNLRRPREEELLEPASDTLFVSFYSPRTEVPESNADNHLWISIQKRTNLFNMIYALLKTIEYEIPPAEKEIHVHFGWPLSSWSDRLSIGVMVHNIIKMPTKFPAFTFHIDYKSRKSEL